MINNFKKAVLPLLALAAFSAQAATTWQFSGSGVNDKNFEPMATTSYTSSTDKVNNVAVTMNISGAYAANGTGAVTTGNWLAPGNPSAAGQPGSDLLYWGGGGLGMCSDPNRTGTSTSSPSCTEPNHALDNGTNTESVLLQFSQSVVLTSIGIGYKSGDADISVFRYIGTGAPTLVGVGASQSAMLAAGWALVGNYADLSVDTSAPFTTVNGSNVGSSYWLISAYNSGIGGTVSSNGGALSNGDDYFKLFGVTTAVCQGSGSTDCGGKKLPEPATLALTSVALMGVFGLRRRKAKLAA